MTLVQFDTQDPYEVIHKFQPLKKIPRLSRKTFVPRAGTPLLDAVGRAINDLEKSLGTLPPAEQPEHVLFAVITDGQENSSQEFKKPQIEMMVKEKTEKDHWQFVYLSADLNAFADAESIGIARSSTLQYDHSGSGVYSMVRALSKATSRYRDKRDDEIFDAFGPGTAKKAKKTT